MDKVYEMLKVFCNIILDLPQVGLLLDTGKMGKSEREAREKKRA